MSNADANKFLAKFGLLCILLALFNLVAIFVSIIGYLFLFLLRYVVYIWMVIRIAMLVLISIGAVMVGKAGNTLNNNNLLTFRTYIIIGSLMIFVGSYLLAFFLPIGFNAIIASTTSKSAGTPEAIAVCVIWVIILIGLLTIMIGGVVINIIAWGRFKKFFNTNMAMFSEDIGKSVILGAFLCQLGIILIRTIFLAIVGYILNGIGYFMLSKLKDAKGSDIVDLKSQEGSD